MLPVTPGISYTLKFWVDFEQPGGLFEAALGTDSGLGPSPGDCYIFIQSPTQGYVNATCSITAASSLANVFFNQGSSGSNPPPPSYANCCSSHTSLRLCPNNGPSAIFPARPICRSKKKQLLQCAGSSASAVTPDV